MTKTMIIEKHDEKTRAWLDSLSKDEFGKILQEDFAEKVSLQPGDIINYYGTEYRIYKDLVSDLKACLIPACAVGVLIVLTESMNDVVRLYESGNIDKALSLTQIGRTTGLSRNTAYRICNYLVFHGFLIRQDDLAYIRASKLKFLVLPF